MHQIAPAAFVKSLTGFKTRQLTREVKREVIGLTNSKASFLRHFFLDIYSKLSLFTEVSIFCKNQTAYNHENYAILNMIFQFSKSYHLGRKIFPHLVDSKLFFSLSSTNLPCFILSLRCTVPMWAVGAIVVVVLALVACLIFCIYKKCFNKGKKPKKVRERKGGRGRRKKDKDGEDGDDKKVRKDVVEGLCRCV